MARYIDAEAVCEALKSMASVQFPDKQSTILGVVSSIENFPTADVVEVVRCKDCRFNTFTQPNGTIHCHQHGNVQFSKQNDFCSKGRRKEQTDG